MKAFATSIFAAGLLIFGAGALAGELADLGAAAESQVKQGNYLGALSALSEAEAKVWKKSPMLFRKTLFVADDPAGFGIYTPRPTSAFKRNERIIIYAEPVGYGYKREGDISLIDLVLDFEVATKAGAVLGSQQGFANPQLRSRVDNREFFVKVVYDFSGISTGEYTVTTTVNDRTSGKTASFSMPFTLTE